MDNTLILADFLRSLGFAPTEQQLALFESFARALLSYNENVNLTAVRNLDEVYIRHFCDSMTAARFTAGAKKVIDIGTGAGFPAIPLAIMQPETVFYAADSIGKKVRFIELATSELGIKNVVPITARVEDLARTELRESFDICVSRAVAALPVLCELGIPLVKIGGKVVCMKGPAVESEIASANKAAKLLGASPFIVDTLQHEIFDGAAKLTCVSEKISPTSAKFPRPTAQIKKKPLV